MMRSQAEYSLLVGWKMHEDWPTIKGHEIFAFASAGRSIPKCKNTVLGPVSDTPVMCSTMGCADVLEELAKKGAVTNSVVPEHDEPGAAALVCAGWGSPVHPVPTSVLPSARIVLLHPWPEVPVRQKFRRTSRQRRSCGYSQPRAHGQHGRRRGKG